jgi:hypothetical protein
VSRPSVSGITNPISSSDGNMSDNDIAPTIGYGKANGANECFRVA